MSAGFHGVNAHMAAPVRFVPPTHEEIMESADEKKGCCGPGEACSAPDCTGTPLTIDGDRRVESEESMAEAEVPPSHPTLDEVVEADLPVMAASGEIPDFAHADDFGALETAARDIDPAKLSVGECTEVAVPAKSELQEAQETLGIGGCIEVGAHAFRVKAVNAGNPRYGHGKTIAQAMYDLNHPGQLKPTVGE